MMRLGQRFTARSEAVKYDIPVFRLETDYQDHDIEQLRIRLEAFREMLSQARCSFGSEAV